MPFVSVPSITQRLVGHWGEFGGGGGEERDAGESSNFFVFYSVKTGGRRKMNSVVQNDTVLVSFYIYIYIYETASFWIKRAVSFKWVKLQVSPPNSVLAPLVGRLFHFGPWHLIYAI